MVIDARLLAFTLEYRSMEVGMAAPVTCLPCGCVWRGEVLDRGCRESEQLRNAMERLPNEGRARNSEWYSLAIKLEREHAPAPVWGQLTKRRKSYAKLVASGQCMIDRRWEGWVL
jgi:hypothetical protein